MKEEIDVVQVILLEFMNGEFNNKKSRKKEKHFIESLNDKQLKLFNEYEREMTASFFDEEKELVEYVLRFVRAIFKEGEDKDARREVLYSRLINFFSEQ